MPAELLIQHVPTIQMCLTACIHCIANQQTPRYVETVRHDVLGDVLVIAIQGVVFRTYQHAVIT